jgi:septal ring-binding cell division protein DamX
LSVALGAPTPVEGREEIPEPVEEVTEEEPALTADIEEDFVVVEPEEAAPVSEPEIPDVGELLSLELETDEKSETEPEVAEESIDDLIASAVLATEETEEKAMPEEEAVSPEGEEAKAEEGVETEQQVPVAAPTQSTDDHDELEQLIAEMKARQKRRRIIGISLVVIVLGILGYGLFGPSSDETVDTLPVDFVAEEPAELPMELVETAEAPEPPPAPVTPPPAPTPAPAPIAPPPAPTRPAAVTPPPRVPTTAAVPSTPSGQYTVHASSYGSMESADRGRDTWRQRGYDHIMVWSWVNPKTGEQWYRLGVGRYATRDDASRAKDSIVSRGFLKADDWAPITRIPEGAR